MPDESKIPNDGNSAGDNNSSSDGAGSGNATAGMGSSPQSTDVNWRTDLGELASNERIAGIKSVRELAQAYINAPQAPKLPNSKDDYQLPEKIRIKGLRQMAHENKMTQAQLDGLLKFNEAVTKAALEQRNARVNNDIAKLKEEWGDNYEAHLKQAERALSKMDFDEGTVQKLLSEAGMAKDPRILKFLHKVGKTLGEDTFINSEGNAKMPSSSLAKRLFPNHPE